MEHTEKQRAELAEIVEKVASEGLPGPKDLDAALDAILTVFWQENAHDITQVEVDAFVGEYIRWEQRTFDNVLWAVIRLSPEGAVQTKNGETFDILADSLSCDEAQHKCTNERIRAGIRAAVQKMLGVDAVARGA